MFEQGPSTTARALLAVILSIVVLGVDQRLNHLEGVRAALATATSPLVYLAAAPARIIDSVSETFSSRNQLEEQNRLLKEENRKLRGRMLRFLAMEEENIRLRGQLGASLKLGDRVSLAEIASVDLDPYHQLVAINRGAMTGVFPGQAVVDANAVMGQVTHVSPFTATVLLITDSRHSLPVRVLRNGLRTIALGTGQIDRLELPYVLPNADIRVGDLLVTSGLGGHFPPDYPVAQVMAVSTSQSGLFGSIIAKPLANLDRAREVMLVWSMDAGMDPDPARPETEPDTAPVQAESPADTGES